MMKALKPRAMRRLLLFMAVIFPIVYLCGSLFFALGGSHGDFSWHENTLSQSMTYEEAMQVENFSYGDWNWENEHGKRLGFSKGFLDVRYEADFDFYVYGWAHGVRTSANFGSLDNRGLGFYDITDSYFSFNIFATIDEQIWIDFDEIVDIPYVSYFPFYFYSGSEGAYYALIGYSYTDNGIQTNGTYLYSNSGSGWNVASLNGINFDSDLTFYFDDGSYLDEGYEFNAFLASYFVPTLKSDESDSLTDFMWSKPFGDNFVSDLGKGVINGNNHGFAPMNTLFHTINDNVLHFSEDDALAMFGFGYVYYAVNVLVIYEVVVLAVKLIMLPLKAVDAIGVNREGD